VTRLTRRQMCDVNRARASRKGSDHMTRLIRAEAEPLDASSLAGLEDVTRASQEALRSSIGSRAGADIPEALTALRGALRASGVPSATIVARRAIQAIKGGLLNIEDLAVTLAIPEVSLVGFDLKIETIGLFRLDTALGDRIGLSEVTLAINPLPPPTIIATLRVSRAFDLTREDEADAL
jgi:hypothetical protein